MSLPFFNLPYFAPQTFFYFATFATTLFLFHRHDFHPFYHGDYSLNCPSNYRAKHVIQWYLSHRCLIWQYIKSGYINRTPRLYIKDLLKISKMPFGRILCLAYADASFWNSLLTRVIHLILWLHWLIFMRIMFVTFKRLWVRWRPTVLKLALYQRNIIITIIISISTFGVLFQNCMLAQLAECTKVD